MANELNSNGGMPLKAITAVLTLLLSIGGVVSWVRGTFVSQSDLAAVREVVERAEAELRDRIIAAEGSSLRRNAQLTERINGVVTILDAGQTEILKALMEHQRDHITSGGCPSAK